MKGGTLMRALVLLFASSFALASAQAGEMAKQGSDSTTVYWVEIPAGAGPREWAGIIRTESGDTMFDKLGVLSTDLGGHGRSTIIDPQGDEVFVTWEMGTFHYVGGTGKYSGISGEATWSCTHPRSPDGRILSICQQKSSWKLP
jgi:hypothetical protein